MKLIVKVKMYMTSINFMKLSFNNDIKTSSSFLTLKIFSFVVCVLSLTFFKILKNKFRLFEQWCVTSKFMIQM